MRFIVRDKRREYEFLLAPGLYIIGRDPTCDLTLESRNVSRRHMSCQVAEDHLEVKDLGSRNGVYVGGVRVRSARLKDADEVRVGDVRLVFSVGAASPGAAGVVPPRVAAAEPVLEDEESTPREGLPVPQEAAGGPQLIERSGRWFVADPATGREVEIVPATQAGTGRTPLLAGPRRRIIIAAAAVVGVLLIAAVVVRLTGEGRQRPGPMSAQTYAAYVRKALEALDQNTPGEAARLAEIAVEGMPSRESAKIVRELARRWPALRQDFFSQWVDIDTLLKDLYRGESSEDVKDFVARQRDWIRRVVADSQRAKEAAGDLQADRYEEAWKKLAAVPRDSPVRQRDADLFQNAHARLEKYLNQTLAMSAGRQDWNTAIEAAHKLGDYFPEKKATADQEAAAYTTCRAHAQLIESARAKLAANDFANAQRALDAIPDTSPYHSEAMRLRDRVKADEQYVTAQSFYTSGQAEKAIEMLARQETPAAAALRLHVQAVADLYGKARGADDAGDLVEAERLWLELTRMETEKDNSYRLQALRRLGAMRAERTRLAQQLFDQAGQMFKKEQFEQARQLYAEASRMDPDGTMGQSGLDRLTTGGIDDYRRGLNLSERDPQEAARLFRRALKMLPADDKYYSRTRDELEKLLRNTGQDK